MAFGNIESIEGATKLLRGSIGAALELRKQLVSVRKGLHVVFATRFARDFGNNAFVEVLNCTGGTQ